MNKFVEGIGDRISIPHNLAAFNNIPSMGSAEHITFEHPSNLKEAITFSGCIVQKGAGRRALNGQLSNPVHKFQNSSATPGGILPPVIYTVTYENGTAEDVEWTRLFESNAFTLVSAPADAKRSNKRKGGITNGGVKLESHNDHGAKKLRASETYPGSHQHNSGTSDTNRSNASTARVAHNGKRSRSKEYSSGDDSELQTQRQVIKKQAPTPKPTSTPHHAPGLHVYTPKELALRPNGAGQIRHIQLINFMNHVNMKVELKPHVNIISGPNGSGKSAILQALQCALGVRAQKTGRASSNATYVKTGTREASVEVTIWNTGPEGDTYFPESFGPFLTIHKKIAKDSGGTTTKVTNSRGQSMGISRVADVMKILDALSVNAGNPAIVMTQENAKSFLTGSNTNKGLFQLFMESLSFSETRNHLRLASNEVGQQVDLVASHMEVLKQHEAKREELNERLRHAQQAEKFNALADMLDIWLPWACVQSVADKVEAGKRDLEGEAPQLRDKLIADLKSANDELAELETAALDRESLRGEIEKRAVALAETRTSKSEAFKVATKKVTGIDRELRQLTDEITTTKRRLAAAKVTLKEFTNKAADTNIEAEMEAWEEAKASGLASFQAREQAHMEAKEKQGAAKDHTIAAQERARALQNEHHHLEQSVSAQETKLNSQMKQSGDTAIACQFNQHAPLILQAIRNNERRFEHPPLGPLGALLTIADPQWSATVSGVLASGLACWIAHSTKDAHTLRASVRQLGFDGHIDIRVYSYNHPQHLVPESAQPPPHLATIYRVLQVKDTCRQRHVVMNLCVDHMSIETQVLCAKYDDGMHLLREGDRYTWQKISCVWAADSKGPWKMEKRGACQNCFPWDQQVPSSQLSNEDPAQYVESLKESLAAEKRRLRDSQDELASCLAEARHEQQLQRTLDQEVVKCYTALQKERAALQRVDLRKPEVTDPDSDISTWMEEVSNAEQAVLRLQPDIKAKEDQLAAARATADEAKQQKAAAVQDSESLQKQMAGADDFLEKVLLRKRKLKSGNLLIEQHLSKCMDSLARLEATLKIHEASYADVLKQAEASIDPDDDDPQEVLKQLPATIQELLPGYSGKYDFQRQLCTSDGVDMLMKLCEKRQGLLELKANNASVEELLIDKEAQENEEQEGIIQKMQLQKLVQLQRRSLKDRIAKYEDIFDCTKRLIDKDFRTKLKSGRGWAGSITVDAEKETLQLSVQPKVEKGGKAVAAVTDLKSLSGGERSFTGVSFVLSLGREVRTPFFAMDEFDVFLDAVNRKVALSSILKFANEMHDTQFILLSPLEMSVVEQARTDINMQLRKEAKDGDHEPRYVKDDFIHTLAMQPPREGARAHN